MRSPLGSASASRARTSLRPAVEAVPRMGPIALLLVVALLVVAGCNRGEGPETQTPLAQKISPRTIRLFFESEQLMLVPETRTVTIPDDDAAAIGSVVRELLKGSANASIPRLFPPDTILRGAYLLPEGNAVIDLGGPTLTEGWNTGSHVEMMAVFSLVETLTANFSSVKRVRLLVNGQPVPTLAGHIEVDRALTPDSSLVAKQ